MPNGILIEWRQISTKQNEDKSVEFIKPFKSNNVQVVAQAGAKTGESATYINGIQIYSITKSSFRIFCAMAATTVRYIAIGY